MPTARFRLARLCATISDFLTQLGYDGGSERDGRSLEASEYTPGVRRAAARVSAIWREEEDAIALAATVETLLALGPGERVARLAAEPGLASPALLEALLERSRERLAPLTEATSAAAREATAREAGALAWLAREVAERLRPDLYPEVLAFDGLAWAGLMSALSALVRREWAGSERALTYADCLSRAGSGDPRLAAELDLAEGLLARARGEWAAARLALRVSAEAYEGCGERASARVVWRLLLELAEQGRAEEPPRPEGEGPALAHVRGVWRSQGPPPPPSAGPEDTTADLRGWLAQFGGADLDGG